jgi:hypothetical protein
VEVRSQLAKIQKREAACAQTRKIEEAVAANIHLSHTNPRLFNRKIMRSITPSGPCPIRDPDTGGLSNVPKRKIALKKEFWEKTMTSTMLKIKPESWLPNNRTYKEIDWT